MKPGKKELTGNKGEWSEIYVFLKLLSDGKLFAADKYLNKNPQLFYPIIKILREEKKNKKREYLINGNIKVFDPVTNKVLISLPVSEFVKSSLYLFERIKKSKGSFTILELESFLKSIDCSSISASRKNKQDINIVVHDLRTGLQPLLGFSIKSMLGKSSTLFNAANFIYEIEHIKHKKVDINKINSIIERPSITNRIKRLLDEGYDLKFKNTESINFMNNLVLIDTKLPDILSFLLLYKYTEKSGSKISELTKILIHKNPLGYNLEFEHPMYEHKIKNFLTDSALGMIPSQRWIGKYDATGGFIIVKTDGELVCNHIYNRFEFQETLFNNTWLDQASKTKHGFGKIYNLNGKSYIKLNLQVRFL